MTQPAVERIAGPSDPITPADGARRPKMLHVATVHITVRAFLRPFGDYFRSLGWKVDAAADGISGSDECRASFDDVWDIPWTRNPLAPVNLTTARGKIARLVREQDYDLVHYHTPVASFISSMALKSVKRRGRPAAIYTAHGFMFHEHRPPLKNLIFRTLEKRICRWSDQLIVINHEDAAAARAHAFIADDRIHYVPGIGVDTSHYDPGAVSSEDVAQVRGELGVAPEEALVLMIAEFNRGKRHDEMLRAFAKLPGKNSHLAFAGVGPLMDASKALANDLGIADRVHFLGFRRDIPALIRSSAVTVLPSEREGLSRAVMESMCLEVPVIATDIRGMGDLLGDGGMLFPVGDVDALADRLSWAVSHRAELTEMGKRARQQIRRFDTKNVLGFHERLYGQILQEQQACRTGS